MSNFAKSVLFDLDGTLIDTAIDMTEVLLTMIKSHHGDLSITNEIARNYVSDGSIGLIKIGIALKYCQKRLSVFTDGRFFTAFSQRLIALLVINTK